MKRALLITALFAFLVSNGPWLPDAALYRGSIWLREVL